jgi:hypothetical protein
VRLNFEEIRRYLPGDDIRQIDWKVTARTRKTHSRVYTEERERTAAEMAALAAWRVLAQKDRVGALVFNDLKVVEIQPQRSRSTVMQILHAVLKQNHALSIDPASSATVSATTGNHDDFLPALPSITTCFLPSSTIRSKRICQRPVNWFSETARVNSKWTSAMTTTAAKSKTHAPRSAQPGGSFSCNARRRCCR